MEDEIRIPDENVVDRLLSPSPLMDEDFEFQQALEWSRREFLELQKKIEKEEKEKERLKKDVRIPMSRLRLLLRNTTNTKEKEYLTFMINRVNHRLYNELDSMPILSEETSTNFLHFLTTQFSPVLFSDIIQICKDCTNPVFISESL